MKTSSVSEVPNETVVPFALGRLQMRRDHLLICGRPQQGGAISTLGHASVSGGWRLCEDDSVQQCATEHLVRTRTEVEAIYQPIGQITYATSRRREIECASGPGHILAGLLEVVVQSTHAVPESVDEATSGLFEV